jgi:hypothetical protein
MSTGADALGLESIRMLTGESAIFDAARAATKALREAGLRGVVIGGVAVFLHGYRRTTDDLDLLVDGLPDDAIRVLGAAGSRSMASPSRASRA